MYGGQKSKRKEKLKLSVIWVLNIWLSKSKGELTWDLQESERWVRNMKEIPFWEKANLTLEEAAAYFSIGQQKLRDLTDNEDCDFVLWIGSKRLIKKNKFLKYIEEQYSIWKIILNFTMACTEIPGLHS